MPYKRPESLLSAKHAEVGPCGLTTNTFLALVKEKPVWLCKVENNQQKEKSIKRFLSHQEKKPREPPQGGIIHQNNVGKSLSMMV